MFFDFLFVFGLVGGDVGNVLAVGAPSELLDTVWGVGKLSGFAAGHGQNKNLGLGVFAGSIDSHEGKTVAIRGQARRADPFALVRQTVLGSRGEVHLDEFAIAAVLFQIRAGDDEYDGFSVGGDLRIGNRGDLCQ